MAASSSSAEITPQKRRKVTCDAAVGGIGHALSNAADGEEQYVLASMHAAEGTTRALAALLRNGALQKAIMKEFNKERLILGIGGVAFSRQCIGRPLKVSNVCVTLAHSLREADACPICAKHGQEATQPDK